MRPSALLCCRALVARFIPGVGCGPCDTEPARARLPRRRTRLGLAGGHHLLGTAQRSLYLAVVLDLYSRRAVGWLWPTTSAMSSRCRTRHRHHFNGGLQGGFKRLLQHCQRRFWAFIIEG